MAMPAIDVMKNGGSCSEKGPELSAAVSAGGNECNDGTGTVGFDTHMDPAECSADCPTVNRPAAEPESLKTAQPVQVAPLWTGGIPTEPAWPMRTLPTPADQR